MPAQALLPGSAANAPIAALTATLGEVTTRELLAETAVGAARGYFEQMDRKKLWLWSALVAAVLVIVGMALRLTREMPAPGETPRPPGEMR
jgi:hypothetical protein